MPSRRGFGRDINEVKARVAAREKTSGFVDDEIPERKAERLSEEEERIQLPEGTPEERSHKDKAATAIFIAELVNILRGREIDYDRHDGQYTVDANNIYPVDCGGMSRNIDFATDPHTMSYRRMSRFIKEQESNGLPVSSYLADLHEKISFPFVNLVVVLVALPFSLKPSRSGSMAGSFVAGLVLGFTYYAVHSFSVALGRAEMFPPIL